MKFFVFVNDWESFVNVWESLAVVTKKSVLVATGVLYLLLLEIQMSKIIKHHTTGSEFYENIL